MLTMKKIAVLLVSATIGLTAHAQGTPVKRNGSPNAPFSSSIWVGDTLYLAGAMSNGEGDTKAQTISVLGNIQKTLKDQGLDMGDVVQMRVYLVKDAAMGKMDFAGMNAGYGQFFGTKEQPNKPVRATVEIAGLALDKSLVEIEVVAVKSAK